jgi:hypothetical protein
LIDQSRNASRRTDPGYYYFEYTGENQAISYFHGNTCDCTHQVPMKEIPLTAGRSQREAGGSD